MQVYACVPEVYSGYQILRLQMDFDAYLTVQIAYLKGKICAAIKIHATGES